MIFRSDKLVKIYGQREVVKSVSIHVDQGEIVGLLGPNGAVPYLLVLNLAL